MDRQNDIIEIAALPPPASRSLTREQKAAVIVRFLLEDNGELDLSELPEDMQVRLTTLLGTMHPVDRDTLHSVVTEFLHELENLGITFPSDLSSALDLMQDRIAPRTVSRLRKQAGLRQDGDPWDRISALQPHDIINLLTNESTEIAAVILSKIETTQAAAVLSDLPGPEARKLSYAISKTRNVTPDAVERIGFSLLGQIDAQPSRAFVEAPEKRLGEILNLSSSATRAELLNGLSEDDEDFGSAVKNNIFTFEDIPNRLKTLDVPKLVKATTPEVLLQALCAAKAYGNAEVAEFLLAHMSNRMASSLREEMEETTAPPSAEGEAAMTQVVKSLKMLAEQGDIELGETGKLD